MNFDQAANRAQNGSSGVGQTQSPWSFSASRPRASVVIPTCNRIDELRDLVISALAQTVPVEVLVMDDSESGAAGEMIHQEFPEVGYHHLAAGRGPAFQRNRGIQLASCDVVFPVDDDTIFTSHHTIGQTLSEFDHPRIAAVGIPYINVRQDSIVRQISPECGRTFVTSAFVGAAHAIRRTVFLRLGGYREHFFYMGEEGDLCLRMMSAGYVTRLGNADPIHHLESPRRNLRRAGFCGRRNDVLFVWHNVPALYLGPHLVGTTINGIRSAIGSHCFGKMMQGTADGYASIISRWHERQPISPRVYNLHRQLKKKGPQLLEQIEPALPSLGPNMVCQAT
ncbi:MAG TPA: glycosyltransferase family A protein [Blastocatellia bacterium]